MTQRTPIGITLNNWGNIRVSKLTWKGKIPQTNYKFEQFEAPVYGIRAMIILLKNYIKQGNTTLDKIINKYAPPNENDTSKYVDTVATRTGMSKYATVQPTEDTMYKIVAAMVQQETGAKVTPQLFSQAWSDSGKSFVQTIKDNKIVTGVIIFFGAMFVLWKNR